MNAAAGTAAVSLGLAGAIIGISTLVAGLRQNNPVLLRAGSRSVWVVLAGALLAAVVMERALFGHDFSLRYVAQNGGRHTPALFTFTTLWSALEGIISPTQARLIACRAHVATVRRQRRWVAHYENRLAYERAMLAESVPRLARRSRRAMFGSRRLTTPRSLSTTTT